MPRPTPPALRVSSFSFLPSLTAQSISAPKLSISAFEMQVQLALQSVLCTWDDMTKFSDREIPVPSGDGFTFFLANAPNPPLSLQLFQWPLPQWQGEDPNEDDYSLNGRTITFYEEPTRPLVAWYRF